MLVEPFTPLKWIFFDTTRSFMKLQNSSRFWSELKNENIVNIYFQMSIEIDSKGYPVVILKDNKSNMFLKIVQGVFYQDSDIDFTHQIELEYGIWIKKEKNGWRHSFFFYRTHFPV